MYIQIFIGLFKLSIICFYFFHLKRKFSISLNAQRKEYRANWYFVPDIKDIVSKFKTLTHLNSSLSSSFVYLLEKKLLIRSHDLQYSLRNFR